MVNPGVIVPSTVRRIWCTTRLFTVQRKYTDEARNPVLCFNLVYERETGWHEVAIATIQIHQKGRTRRHDLT